MAESSPLRVLLLAGRFEVRAACAYTLRLLENLKSETNEDIDAFMVCSDATQIEPDKRAGLNISEYRFFDRPIWGRVPLEAIHRQWQAEPPDLIHLQSPAVYAQGIWLARRWGRPVVMTVPRPLPPRQRFPEVGARCRKVIAISQSVADGLVRRNRVAAEKIVVINSGVSTPTVDACPLVLAANRNPVIGTAGPLETAKGLPFFLGAAARVARSYPHCDFLISGAGPEEHNLRRLTRNLHLEDRVTFVSQLYDFELSLEAMDIFCLPSLQQGLGVTMLEAMARGRPVIATGVGAVEQILTDNETGLIVPPSNSQRLAQRMVELLDDPQRARVMGEAGRQYVLENFRVDRMVAATAEVYRAIVPAGAAAA